MNYNIDYILNEWEKDLNNLKELREDEQISIIDNLMFKYNNILFKYVIINLLNLSKKYKILYNDKKYYYGGVGDKVHSVKHRGTSIVDAVNADDEVNDLAFKIEYFKRMEKLLNNILEILKFKPNNIKIKMDIEAHYRGEY